MTYSILHAPLETIKDLFAASSKWQSWTETKSSTEAKAFIYLISVSTASIKRPHLLIMNGDRYRLEKVGQPCSFLASGSAILRFEATAESLLTVKDGEPTDTSEYAICSAFLNKIGEVISDVLQNAAPSLDIKSISRRGGLARSEEEQYSAHENIVQLEFELEW